MKFPVANKISHTEKIHGEIVKDDYHWLRDQNWPKVKDKDILGYLKKENSCAEKFFSSKKKLQNKIYKELISRIKLADKSTPIKRRNYYYLIQTLEKAQYPIHLRQKAGGKEEILFDENKESKGLEFFQLGCLTISPNEKLLAYSTDIRGDEYYTLRVRDLNANQDLNDAIENIIGTVIWNNDNTGFYYTKLNDKWRPDKVYYHKLGTTQKDDILVYEEKDVTFRVGVSKSTDEKFIFIDVSSSDSNEVRVINAQHKEHVLIKRKKDHLFDIDHIAQDFYLHTNDKGKNFRLVRISDSKKFTAKNYVELISHSDDEYLIDFDLYDNNLVITKKILGIPNIMVYDYQLNLIDNIKFPDEAYSAGTIFSWRDDDGIMINYSSMRTPQSTMKYIFKTKELLTLKEQEIPCGYDKNQYQSERLYIKSRDHKAKIPVSLVYKKSLMKEDGSNPLLLYGYGSYGISISPSFNTNILSLLDRGFVFAIAHVRGGDDLGFKWYESAKFLHKKRTFNDFIDVLKFLAKSTYSAEGKISILGGSAGGMLVGVALNEAGSLLKSAIADVPFVDVLNTMLDENLPLTPGEFKEWGNPKEKKYFDYIKSYSPYDNITAQNYPHILVLAGLNDPRVTYWEPAKYVAKLRDKKTDNNILLLETKMHAGHQGKTGRFERYREVAKKYVFLLETHGINT